jgi:hypothetical protein
MIVVRMPVTDTEYEARPSWCAPRGLITAELLAKTNTRSRRTTTHRLARNNRLDSEESFQFVQNERNINYDFQLVHWRSFLWCNSGNHRHPPYQPNNDKGIASCMTHRQAHGIACKRFQENLWHEKLPTEKVFPAQIWGVLGKLNLLEVFWKVGTSKRHFLARDRVVWPIDRQNRPSLFCWARWQEMNKIKN